MPTAYCHLYEAEHSLGITSHQLCPVGYIHQTSRHLSILSHAATGKVHSSQFRNFRPLVPSLFSPHRGIPKLKTIFGNYFSVSNFECLSLRPGASIINLYGSVIEFVISLGACTIKLDGFLFCDKRKNFRSAESKTFFP